MNKQKSVFQQQARHFSRASYLTPTMPHSVKHRGTSTIKNWVRTTMIGLTALLCLFTVTSVQAFPPLNLMTDSPDIESSFINVDYTGNNAGGSLTASGSANVLTPPGSPTGNILGGTFDINSIINFDAQTASGSLTIGGTIASQGFNSGTLLTGTFSSTAGNQTFGAGAGDPLEYLFNVTGGDAAGLFGSTAGVILSQSGFSGSFNADFSSGTFQGLSDTFGVPQDRVPEPGTLGLIFLGGGLLAYNRRKRSTANYY